jgi:hypothetical protein
MDCRIRRWIRTFALAGMVGLVGATPILAQQARPPARTAPAPEAAPKAPEARPVPPRPPAAEAGGRTSPDPLIDESFAIRRDEELYQLEEATTLIASSLSRLRRQVSTLAVNSFYFGKEIDPDFRRQAEVVMLYKMTLRNPNVRLVQCLECQRLDAKVAQGVIQLRKGIQSVEERRELAKKLGVDGFIDLGMFREGAQITVFLKVVEAQTGAILLVDALSGRPAPKRETLTFSFGELNFPIVIKDNGNKETTHNTLALTVTQTAQLTSRFSLGVDLAIWADNNQYNPKPHLTLASGLLLAPSLNFDVMQLRASTSRLIAYVGFGKLIAPQLDYANLIRAGFQAVIGDRVVIVMGANSFSDSKVALTSGDKTKEPLLAGGATLTGVGYEIRFGYRF